MQPNYKPCLHIFRLTLRLRGLNGFSGKKIAYKQKPTNETRRKIGVRGFYQKTPKPRSEERTFFDIFSAVLSNIDKRRLYGGSTDNKWRSRSITNFFATADFRVSFRRKSTKNLKIEQMFPIERCVEKSTVNKNHSDTVLATPTRSNSYLDTKVPIELARDRRPSAITLYTVKISKNIWRSNA